MTPAIVILVMGVSGSGKTTVGNLLADHLNGYFIDGDDFHPAENIQKMSHGTPLSDDDRWPWLDSIVAAVQARSDVCPVIIACSALKERYRQRLREIPLQLVYLKGDKTLIEKRIQERTEHFMPATLLTSQFAELEEPDSAIVAPVSWPPEDIVKHVITELSSQTFFGLHHQKY